MSGFFAHADVVPQSSMPAFSEKEQISQERKKVAWMIMGIGVCIVVTTGLWGLAWIRNTPKK